MIKLRFGDFNTNVTVRSFPNRPKTAMLGGGGTELAGAPPLALQPAVLSMSNLRAHENYKLKTRVKLRCNAAQDRKEGFTLDCAQK